MTTETVYIQFYIETILSFQEKYAEGKKLPLCIMTSGDTNAKTVAILEKNNNFGMDKDQITIVIQGDGVPALENNDAKLALDPLDRYKVLSKPHGHGDIHALLHSDGVAKKWLSDGIKWTVFFQVNLFQNCVIVQFSIVNFFVFCLTLFGISITFSFS